MRNVLLYYVAVPCTEEVINLITLFSISIGDCDIPEIGTQRSGLFIYGDCLKLEAVYTDTEWLLDTKDAEQVLAFYANKDFNSICAYLNSIPERPFNVLTDSSYYV